MGPEHRPGADPPALVALGVAEPGPLTPIKSLGFLQPSLFLCSVMTVGMSLWSRNPTVTAHLQPVRIHVRCLLTPLWWNSSPAGPSCTTQLPCASPPQIVFWLRAVAEGAWSRGEA